MQNNDKFAGFFALLMFAVYGIAWVGSGYLAWSWIGVSSFGSAVMWLLVWGILGGIAKFVASFVIMLLMAAADNLMNEQHSGSLKHQAPRLQNDGVKHHLMQSKIDEIAQGDEQLKAKITEMMNGVGREIAHAQRRFLNNDYQPLPFWSIHGRMRRRTYALWFIPAFIVFVVFQRGAEIAISRLSIENITFTNLLIPSLIAFIPVIFMIFLGVKRLHDCDYKGWWLLIPFVNIAILFVRGTQGNNRFGADPRPENDYLNDDDAFKSDYSFWGVLVLAILFTMGQIRVAIIEVERYMRSQERYMQSQQKTTAISHATTVVPSAGTTFSQPANTYTPPVYSQSQAVQPVKTAPTTTTPPTAATNRATTVAPSADTTFSQPANTYTPPVYSQSQAVQPVQTAPTTTTLPTAAPAMPPSTTNVQYGSLLGRVLTLSNNAHVRDCPNKQCKSFGVIPLGGQVIVVQNSADGLFVSGNWLYINYEGNFCYQYVSRQNTCRNYAQARVAGWLHIGALAGNYGVPQPQKN